MARPPELFSLASLTLLLALVVEPHGAYGTTRGSFGPNDGASEVGGICATSVTIHGYKCQEHQAETKDGYILSMQRIPEGRNGGAGNTKQPILIQHGVLVDGMAWLLNSPQENLPMILADKGFDVWIANTRGTRFCRKHVSLDSSQPEFWNWSWDELVSFDLPAVFDFVFNQTQQKIHYIGHSLGTLIGLASFSEGHQANTLKSAAFLSPIAYLSHMNTALGTVAAKAFVGEVTTWFGVAEFNPKVQQASAFLKSLCNYPGVDCYDLLSAITGKNCCLNFSTVDLFIKNEPQSTATKNMVHLAQRFIVVLAYTCIKGIVLIGTPICPGKVQVYARVTIESRYVERHEKMSWNIVKLDYNEMHYGAAKPPVYNISNIPRDLPIFISYGGQDALSDIQDVQLLLDSLKFHDVNKLMTQFIKDYAHADFVMGINAKDVVYNQVVMFFENQQ
ncbi:Triacylglycerol lipase 2 [Hibiscus syriacus]|uniref:Triacylglycerol lipase 2 n=1 Tax=Hibiscus syriacus TaxID=106335 RepID=A0A6A3AKB4_HIBSY|nr:Triacylglycerol lipase 2 [Hibiscus syriacus]